MIARRRLIGLLLLLHAAVVCTIKAAQGLPEEVWWLSHVGLALAGMGFLINSPRLLSAVLIAITFPHLIWLVDAMIRALGGDGFGVTRYLAHADGWTWLSTLHHFYLLPLLLIWAVKRREFHRIAVLDATLFLALLLLVSRLLPPASNVNYAYSVMPTADWTLIRTVNALPYATFLLVEIGWVLMVFHIPAAFVLRSVAERPGAAPRAGMNFAAGGAERIAA